jgi:hypothetical protein
MHGGSVDKEALDVFASPADSELRFVYISIRNEQYIKHHSPYQGVKTK